MKPILTLLLAWLVPGAGHFYLGKRRQAWIYFVAITSTFLAGSIMAGGRNLWYYQYMASFYVQMLAGGPSLAVLAWQAGQPYVPAVGRVLDAGRLYAVVAGLLNLMVILDALGPVLGAGEGKESAC